MIDDDLIKRKWVLDLADQGAKDYKEIGNVEGSIACRIMKLNVMKLETVEAVHIDPLCEWLSDHCGKPPQCVNKLCGKCDLDGKGHLYAECWKYALRSLPDGMEGGERIGTD